MEPFAAAIAPDESDCTDDPVQTHGQPDAGQLHIQLINEEVAQAYPDGPHGDHGHQHGEAGVSYDFPDSSTGSDGSRNYGGNSIANDSFQNNVGSSAEDIINGFGGYGDTNIAGMTIENNGAQTAYDSNGEVQGVRMANKATSTKGSPDYKYDSVSSSGITDSAEAANQFGEPATTTDGGKTWQTQSGTRYERMSSANTNFYNRDSGRTKIVDGQDSQNRSYAYVSTEKPKGFSSNSRSQGDGRKERKSRRRSGARK